MAKLKTAIVSAAVATMLLVTAGCNMLPFFMHLFARPEKVEPVCTIPPDVKILVLVDDLKLSEAGLEHERDAADAKIAAALTPGTPSRIMRDILRVETGGDDDDESK